MIYGDWIGRWARGYPDKEALVDAIEGRRYTYGQLACDMNRMAEFLRRDLGIVKGDRVACLAFNRIEYIWLFMALSRLGAIMVPLNFRLATGEYIYMLKDSAPKVFFFDREHQNVVDALKAESRLPHYVCFDNDDSVGLSLPDIWQSLSPDSPPEMEINVGDTQLIIYTSGTTGMPKGVLLTHGMLTWNAINSTLGWNLGPDDRTILHSAMFYTAGWNVLTLPIFYSRGVNNLVRRFDPDLILDLIAGEGVTVFFGVPTMFQMLALSPKFAATDFYRVRFLVSGGAALDRSAYETYKKEKSARIWEGYGLTEVGPNCFMANGKLGTVGHTMPHVDLKLIGVNGHEVPVGGEGEILLKGPHVCAGYLNNPQATAETIVDGWFHTGDLGRLDCDGHLSIVGRLKDMIISGGANIYPAEIERAIDTHPAVAASAVIGVPDSKWGEVGKAIVELIPGASLTLDELVMFLQDRLGKFKMPKYMAVVDKMPRTPASEKIQKFILKEKHGSPENG